MDQMSETPMPHVAASPATASPVKAKYFMESGARGKPLAPRLAKWKQIK